MTSHASNIRVMSWNLRTFNESKPTHIVTKIRDYILEKHIDILCIQEVQAGAGTKRQREIGTSVTTGIQKKLDELNALLKNSDKHSNWKYTTTGLNSSGEGRMRDSYAFFYKETPQVNTSNSNPANKITLAASVDGASNNPIIIRWGYKNGFRRPGKIKFIVSVGSSKTDVPLEIYSFHAPSYNDGPTTGVKQLASCTGGIGPSDTNFPVPDPQIPKIILGDFNCPKINIPPLPNQPYFSFNKYYRMCIGTAANPIKTTYTSTAPAPTTPAHTPVTLTNPYDNIYSLKQQASSDPELVLVGTGAAFDFINEEIYKSSASPATIFHELYGVQHTPSGVSDHLPVYQEFSLKAN